MRSVIDTHTHLYDIADPMSVLAAAAAAGVSDVVALGVDLSSCRRHLDIVALAAGRSGFPRIYLGLGLHPGNITSEADTEACFSFFRTTLARAGIDGPPVAAIGECGLDFWYPQVRDNAAKKDEQRGVFRRHLVLARDFGLPVVIHCRGAWRECLEMTRDAGISRAVFHWYSGPLDVLADIVAAGYLVSGTPALEYSREARAAVAAAPLAHVMVETDTPVAFRRPGSGERVPSTPAEVWRSLRAMADVRAMEEDALLAAVNANARSFFGMPVVK